MVFRPTLARMNVLAVGQVEQGILGKTHGCETKYHGARQRARKNMRPLVFVAPRSFSLGVRDTAEGNRVGLGTLQKGPRKGRFATAPEDKPCGGAKGLTCLILAGCTEESARR